LFQVCYIIKIKNTLFPFEIKYFNDYDKGNSIIKVFISNKT